GTAQLRVSKKAVVPFNHFGFWVSAVAAVLVAAVLVYLSPFQIEAVPEFEKYVALTEQKTVTLTDQSSIVLSPNSQIEVQYSQSARELHLHKGQIFLSVTKDAQRPFKVLTHQGAVRVMGTQFTVQQLAEDLKITVVEGVVGLLTSERAKLDQTPFVVLHKNQQILYSDALKGAPPTAVDAARETSWSKGRMIFDGDALGEVTVALNEHLSPQIQIASPELRNKRIVGAISVKNSRVAAASLATIVGAVVEETPNQDALLLKSVSDESSEK
ncbi:MAG TPA: FecR domain-containing protein, partial [Cellvibrionaceae bacterium]|nr:FecR domain-containing protein [Cellvibrionaceae bacterium]